MKKYITKRFKNQVFVFIFNFVFVGVSFGQSATIPSDVNLTGDASPNYVNNFIHVMSPLTDLGDSGEMIESINFFDGLGRPVQSTLHEASGDQTKDIIIPIIYDAFGRQVKDYLPFASTQNGNLHANPTSISNYTGYYGSIEDDHVFSEKHLEASPLNRIKEQGAPGETWQLDKLNDTDKTIKFENGSNAVSEVRLWTIDTNGDLSTSGYYTINKLYKTITKDENWTSGTDHTTVEFKDKQGRVVLKRAYESGAANAKHDTYYVYDDFGNLRFVIPPKAEGTSSTSISSTVLSELCYQYTYDNKNRLIEKQIPGKGKESIVYDNLDRPVMTQDSIQDINNEWLFTKYDALGRVIYTGIYFYNISRSNLQSTFNGKSNVDLYETKLTSSGTLGIYYSNDDFPNSSLEVLTVNYYDNYTFDIVSLGTIPTVVQGATVNTTVARGLATGSKVKVLDQSPIKWVTTAIYYDNNARTIYTTSDNSYLDTQDKVEMELDFRGKATKTLSNHVKGTNTAIVITEDFDYDDMERLLAHKHKKDAMDQETLAINTYDELGQLISKGVGNKSSSGTRLQTVDYAYNIRGWLKQINDVNNIGTDLFAFNLKYNDIADVNKRLYNGNISQTLWKTANTDGSLKDYEYTYDALNRITNAVGGSTDHYDLDLVQYDKNGNITKLEREGHLTTAATTFGSMDNLSYYYNGNRLHSVTDSSGKTTGFNDGNSSDTVYDNGNDDYSYDVNGNLLTDANKGITSITYNHLNLPKQVTFSGGNIQYKYDATGVKQKKIVSTGNTILYAGNFVYEDNGTVEELKFFNHAEGYVEPDGSSFDYVYQYKDHLGNIRLSYSDKNGDGDVDVTSDPLTTELIEEHNYYPFGLKHQGYNTAINGTHHKYMFGGKEYQDDVVGGNSFEMYDFGARNYDPALGRWMNIDPLAEGYENWSPYGYAFSNPIYFIDPDGERIRIGDNYYSYEEGRNYDEIKDEFERNTYKALDALYSSSAMEIDFGGDIGVVNVLDKLIGDKDVTVDIFQSSDEGSRSLNNKIRFADKFGAVITTKAGVSQEDLDKAAESGELTEGVGYNSPTSQLGHELIHSYNYNYDRGDYDKKTRTFKKGVGYEGRRADKSTKSTDSNKPHYSNGEEKRTTTLGNQVNHALNEAQRFDYRGAPYKTESPTSTKPLKVKAND